MLCSWTTVIAYTCLAAHLTKHDRHQHGPGHPYPDARLPQGPPAPSPKPNATPHYRACPCRACTAASCFVLWQEHGSCFLAHAGSAGRPSTSASMQVAHRQGCGHGQLTRGPERGAHIIHPVPWEVTRAHGVTLGVTPLANIGSAAWIPSR